MADPRPATGSLAAVLYDVEGDRIWHQRYVLGATESLEIEGAWDVAVATPDSDVYLELLSNQNPDILAVRWQTVPTDPPVGVPRPQWYRFRQLPTGATLQRLQDRAERLLAAEARRRGVAATRPPGGGRPASGAHGVGGGRDGAVRSEAGSEHPGLPAQMAPWAAGPGLQPGPDRPPGAEVWKAARTEHGVLQGTVIQVRGEDLINGSRTKGIHMLTDGGEIFIEREMILREADVADGGATPRGGHEDLDARVLKVGFDATGARHRVWRDVCLRIKQVDFSDWSLPGPRTVLWCANFCNRRGGGPVEHHRWWLANARLQVTDFGVQEHEHGMRAFQFFGEYDQCDLPNLMGLEVIIRRCQVIEYHYEKKRAASAAKDSANQQGLTRDEASYFSGVHRLAGEAMICPELVEWVGKELGRDMEVQKQMRKAREEAKLLRDGK